jgi:hypothetical protein
MKVTRNTILFFYVVSLVLTMFGLQRGDREVMTSYPSSRKCAKTFMVEKCVMALYESNSVVQSDIQEQFQRENSTDRFIQKVGKDELGVWCDGQSDLEYIIAEHRKVYDLCDKDGCSAWSWILSTLSMQENTDWIFRAFVGVIISATYTLIVSAKRSSSGPMLLTLGFGSLVASLCLTNIIYFCMGYESNMVTDSATLVVVGTGMDAVILSIHDSCTGRAPPRIVMATFLSSLTSAITFFILYLSLDVGDAKGFFLKGSIGFTVCIIHRMLFLDQWMVGQDYGTVSNNGLRTTPVSKKDYRGTFAALVLVCNVVVAVNTSFPSVHYSFKDVYPAGSRDYIFHETLENMDVTLPFVLTSENGSSPIRNTVANEFGLRLASTTVEGYGRVTQVWTLRHGLFLDDSMFHLINAVDDAVSSTGGCLSCQMCDIVDTFNILMYTMPVVIVLLSVIIAALSIFLNAAGKGCMGVLCLFFSQVVSLFVVVSTNGHLNLIDLMVMSCVPGIGIDYILHLILADDNELAFVKRSIFHCYMTTSMCFYGLLTSEFVLIREMATSFLVSLTVTFVESLCLSFFVERVSISGSLRSEHRGDHVEGDTATKMFTSI